MPQVQRAVHLALPMQLRQVASRRPGHLQGLVPGQAPLLLHENCSQQRLSRLQGGLLQAPQRPIFAEMGMLSQGGDTAPSHKPVRTKQCRHQISVPSLVASSLQGQPVEQGASLQAQPKEQDGPCPVGTLLAQWAP